MTKNADRPDLNPDQRAAVTASMEPQLVVAGPGTGKTRVLVCRAAHLIEHAGLTPSHLVLITFTRRAAAQLTRRLAALVGPEAQHVRAGTIHHFCYETLRAFPDRGDVPEDFVVVDDSVTDAFWQRWYEENEQWCERNYLGSYRQVKTRISRIKLGIDTVSGRLNEGLHAYNEMLADRGALDFDDLLVNTRDLLREHDAVRAALVEETDAILVDEFQDTDPVQFDVVRRLGTEGVHLFCVADDDQSIYRFRGARPQNVHRFIDQFDCREENGTLHILTTNYRSDHSIFSVAEAVLDGEERLKRRGEIHTQADGTAPVRLVACDDREHERLFALRQIQEWIEDGAHRGEIAVLTRWNRRLAALERDVLRAGIACETSSAENLLDTPPARALHALLRVIDARRRDRPVEAPMNELLDQLLPDEVMARLRDFARRQMPDHSDWTVFQTVVSNQKARHAAGLDQANDRLDRVYATIRNLLPMTRNDDRTIGGFVTDALRQIGGPLQLLSQHTASLTDPTELPSIREAGEVLSQWATAQHSSPPPRLLLHHRTPQITRLWRQLVRRALNLESDPPAPLPEAQEALFARPAEDGIPPLGPQDIVLTTDLEAFLRWADRTDALPDPNTPPQVLLLAPDASLPAEQNTLLGFDPSDISVVDPEQTFHSPSVRLFKCLQAATGPSAAEPLFPEYVMVDLEATSTDPRQCRVAEIGALKVRNGTIVDEFSALVELPDDLTEDERETLREVCDLDPGTDFADARPEAEVWADLCDFVGTAPLVAHNGQRYDFRVLRRLDAEHAADARWTTTYDLLPAAHELFPDLRRYSAAALRAQLLDDTTSTAHRALDDCKDQQRLLTHFQQERARQHRIQAHESLLPLLAAALTYEEPSPDALSPDAEALLQVGYVWALRDASPAGPDLRSMLPRALTDRLRQHLLYTLIKEETIPTADSGLQPGLARRLNALFSPYADRPLLSDALEELLTHLALWGDNDTATGDDVVTLSTYHSAKGLEFERVVCMDVHDNAFPPYFARDPEERRESRRLLYVGMTRAERHLVLTYPKQERGYTRRPSPFLDAAPDALLETTTQTDATPPH
ncbi:3'-5' exonuclease [Salinibacter sp. 10B]|uniref:UvrD-helicase domain-containing protein n=1 Tax=Salinibacter sp. 10B TaxID=1923971 RepID=UPI000CF50399|nr:UvrD-helicase domain-containing protein [Salinibacter sp. 10B]PQJ35086.1 3'-5' exonuclease [Salinibacter sp. 10B]